MALPAIVSSSSRWSDFKNAQLGPYRGVNAIISLSSVAGTLAIGNLAQNSKRGQAFQATADGPLMRATFLMSKSGSPTDNVICELYSVTGSPVKPDTLLASSLPIASAAFQVLPAYAEASFVFPVPVSLVNGTSYAVSIKRSGGLDSTNFPRVSDANNPYSGGHIVGYNSDTSAWTASTSLDLAFAVEQQTSAFYQLVLDSTNSKARMIKSSDAGQTWAEVDSANAPAVSTTVNFKSFSSHREYDKVYVGTTSGSTTGSVIPFLMASDTWGTALTGPAKTVNTGVSGTVPIFAFRRPDGSTVMIYNGTTETIMGQARRRIKLTRHSGTSWGTEYDVISSAGGGAPPSTVNPDTTLPGVAVSYDLRAAIMTDTFHICIFYTQDDDNLLRCRIWRYDFLTPSTENFSNILNPATADAPNAVKYAAGQAASYFDGGEPWVALPYKDNSDTFLKLIRCKADETMFTAGNWASGQIQAIVPETDLSNPAALTADSSQGGRLFAFYTKSSRLIYYSEDGGSGAWTGETQWRSGQTCGALNINIADDRVALGYLDEAPTPDEVRYDAIDVFF